MLKTVSNILCSAALMAVAIPALAGKGEPWLTDMDQAEKIAKAEGKDIFMYFTGSDWCGWCIKLDDEVLSQQAFLDYAKDNLVLVDLDFPRDEELLSEEQKAHNEQWRERFPVRGYPTVFITDTGVSRYAATGYRPGGPEQYVEHLQTLKAGKIERDSTLAKADKASGLKRAKLLDEALSLEGSFVENSDQLMTEIIELSKADTELNSKYVGIKGNKNLMEEMMAQRKGRPEPEDSLQTMLGLFDKYSYLKDGQSLTMLVGNISRLYSMTDQQDAAGAFLDKVIADNSYSGDVRQSAGVSKAFMVAESQGIEAATAVLDKAIALSPESYTAKNRDSMVKRMESMIARAQEQAKK